MSTPDKPESGFTPFVPEETDLPELTFRAVFLGVIMAIVLGAANAYLGMRAGLTVAATFPAAVVAMAALRALGGSVLEENISRTTASVGEALVGVGFIVGPSIASTLFAGAVMGWLLLVPLGLFLNPEIMT